MGQELTYITEAVLSLNWRWSHSCDSRPNMLDSCLRHSGFIFTKGDYNNLKEIQDKTIFSFFFVVLPKLHEVFMCFYSRLGEVFIETVSLYASRKFSVSWSYPSPRIIHVHEENLIDGFC